MGNPLSKLLCIRFFILLLLYIHSRLCLAADRITGRQTLRNNETLVSAGGVFELGFFSPANSNLSYVGIWYHEISPQTVVFIFNRDNPITHNLFSSELRFEDGILIFYTIREFENNSQPFGTTPSSNPVAVLQDDGNFVIRDFDSSLSLPLWQSFDHPTDTILPGQLFVQNQTLISWNSDSDPAQGPYSLQLDSERTDFVTLYHKVYTMYSILQTENGFDLSITSPGYGYFAFRVEKTRIIINSEGMVQRLSWVEASKNWSLNWQQPRDPCQLFGHCGSFGICDSASSPLCSCPTGFVLKSEKEWSLGHFSRGCLRKSRLVCMNSDGANDNNGDMFVPGYGLPDNGELFNLHTLRKERYSESVYIRTAGSMNSDHVSSSRNRVVIGVIVASVVSVMALFLIFRRNSRRKAAVNMAEIEKHKYEIAGGNEQNNSQLCFFSFKDVLAATDNFSESNKLGEGGFGPVYKGKLSDDQEVAMKRLSKKSGQGLEEFMNELKLIAKLQHTYLVRLLGCCVEREEKILIYEYMPNRSLDMILFGKSNKAKLDWGQRVKIAEGVAQGLLYIHKYSRLKVIHRDMKASNALLDATMNPKISDFGLARIFGIDQNEGNTNRIFGTYGYMSPEYAFYGQFSEKSDVFSFGVLLLEIVSGKRNKDFYRREIPSSLLSWVWELWKEGKPEGLIDRAVKNSPCCNPTQAIKFIQVGLLCVQEAPTDRPTMSSVTLMLLSNDSQSLPSPREPAFTTRRGFHPECSYQVPVNCSNNQVTMSLPTGR